MASNTYELPENPGFIGGIYWQGFFLGLLIRVVALELVVEIVAYAARLSGIVLPGPRIDVLGIPIYGPWYAPLWVVKYWRDAFFAKSFFHYALLWFLPVIVISQVMMRGLPSRIFASHIKRYANKQHQLYGSNYWAERKDLEEARLLDGQGILLGAVENEG